MNEKLKDAVRATHGECQSELVVYGILLAAAQGKYPGFQLVPVELSEKNKRAVFLALAYADDEQRLWNDLLAASKEEFK